jgi:hypothetical protein
VYHCFSFSIFIMIFIFIHWCYRIISFRTIFQNLEHCHFTGCLCTFCLRCRGHGLDLSTEQWRNVLSLKNGKYEEKLCGD